jgi:hypothetical protein
MKQLRWFRALGLAAITLMVSLTLAAQGDLTAIQQKLNSQFKVTTITADRSDIVTAGDVVVIHKPGLIMYYVASPMPPSNTYKNGRISQGWGGFGKDLAITMLTPGGGTSASYPQRPFVPEEKCWVTGIQAQKDGVLFQLYSDPYNYIRYYANLKIPFPNKKEIPSADAAMQLVAEVLTVVPQDQGAQGGQPVQGEQYTAFAGEYLIEMTGQRYILLPDGSCSIRNPAGTQSPCQFIVDGDWIRVVMKIGSTNITIGNFKIQGDKLYMNGTVELVRQGVPPTPAPEPTAAAPPAPPAPAPMPVIAPPPPPADAPPPTIELGQTMDQVTTGFGQPLRIAKLGVKTIYYYKDMKVTFTNGKVSNVE